MQDDSEFLTLKQLCDALSITTATGRNWLKTGKIYPQKIDGNKKLFSGQYLLDLQKLIRKNTGTLLKSRRNKKFVSGSCFYRNYISSNSPNYNIICKVTQSKQGADPAKIRAIIAGCARELIADRFRGRIPEPLEELIKDISPAIVCQEKYTFVHGEDTLGILYVSMLDMRKRKAAGIYYTPLKIVDDVISTLFTDGVSGKVCDPCCGTGNFILRLPDDSDPALVYGGDTDPLAVAIARINFLLKYKITDTAFVKEHIVKQDFLHCKTGQKFDYIIGNPPWGYEFTAQECNFIRRHFKTAGSQIESACCMTEKAVSLLTPAGTLAFVLPESLLHTRKHRAFREFICTQCSVNFVKYLGEGFDGVQCPGVIAGLTPGVQAGDITVTRNNQSFDVDPSFALLPDGFRLNIKKEETAVIKKITELPSQVSLKDNAVFAMGIVTGNNRKYLATHALFPQHEPIICGTDVHKFRISSPETYICFEPEKFQQTVPENIYRTVPKLLYRFISRKLIFACDFNGTLALNSCNILIPRIKDLDIRYIMAVLNSGTAQFFFSKCFNSVKVLRSHLEAIPIPYAGQSIQQEIISLIDKLSDSSYCHTEICGELDKKIAAIYGLDDSEYRIITAAVN